MNNRVVRITGNTVVSTVGATFEGIIFYMGGGGTPNTTISVHDVSSASDAANGNLLAKFQTTAQPPNGDDYRGFKLVTTTGLYVSSSDWTGLEVFVLYC